MLYLTAVNDVFRKRSDKKTGSRCLQMCKPYKMYDSVEKEKQAKKNYDNFIQFMRESTKARFRVEC